MPDGFSVEAHDLEELVLKIKTAAERSRLEVDKGMAEIGEAHKVAAKKALEGHSTSIPPTIRSEPLPGAHAVRLTATGTALAWAYERGNKTNRRGKTFVHPIFGQGEAEQDRFPFFKTARRQLRLWTTRTLTDAWKRAMRGSGLKVE